MCRVKAHLVMCQCRTGPLFSGIGGGRHDPIPFISSSVIQHDCARCPYATWTDSRRPRRIRMHADGRSPVRRLDSGAAPFRQWSRSASGHNGPFRCRRVPADHLRPRSVRPRTAARNARGAIRCARRASWNSLANHGQPAPASATNRSRKRRATRPRGFAP